MGKAKYTLTVSGEGHAEDPFVCYFDSDPREDIEQLHNELDRIKHGARNCYPSLSCGPMVCPIIKPPIEDEFSKLKAELERVREALRTLKREYEHDFGDSLAAMVDEALGEP